MSGGRLVVLDRAGRDVKRYPLAEGLATLGSDPACDIRIMLPTVSAHHATVVVHANQTVVRNVCEDETLVNGRHVSVAALRHGDVISIGGRQLRWEYTDPGKRRPQAPEPALYVSRRAPRGRARRSGPAGGARDPALQLALEMSHRASMPGSAGGKQVAIVQPQRRDTGDHIDKTPPRSPLQASKRARTSKSDLDTSLSEAEQEKSKRKSVARLSPANLQNTTKATLWIESRKPPHAARTRRSASARKSTPLRLAVLKRAQSAHRLSVTKIEGPLKIDHTKQAAIRLMTGHSPKPKPPSPSFVVKKPSPVRHTPRLRNSRSTPGSSRASPGSTRTTPGSTRATPGSTRATPGSSRATPGSSRATPDSRRTTLDNSRATPGNSSRRSDTDRTVTILEISDSDGRYSSLRNSSASRRSASKSAKKSFGSSSPRKSALKDPSAKRGVRKTESIKFDLSNLENHSQDNDETMFSDTGRSYVSDDDVTLRYSPSLSPSPRRSIHSRSSRILHSSLGDAGLALPAPPGALPAPPATPRSPKRSSRGSLMLQKALDATESYSRRTTKSVSDNSRDASRAAAFRTRTLSPRASRNHLESYSIVDLVSIDTDESALSTSVYNSAGSTASTAFGTPQNSTGRKTRSTIDATLLGSSTPYVKARASTPRSRSNPSPHVSRQASVNDTQSTVRSSRSKRSKSLSTPENTEDAKKHISVNSTRISRASRSRSRINDSELLLLDDDDDSPRTSKRISTTSKTSRVSAQTSDDTGPSPSHSPAQGDGTFTPENRHSPEEASTPVLSIQSLLDSSHNSFASQRPTKGRPSFKTKRKTVGGVTGPKTRVGAKSKSLSFSARKTRLRLSDESVEVLNKTDESEIVTPKSAVKLMPEGVKNKHSTAKKPQSKRSIIDDLNESDIVKQLFNSPVKRKLSQSMTEFSRKQLFDDDDVVQRKRPTRNTIAITGRTPDNSLLDHTESYTPEIFVSPISTPTRSPSLDGIKLMFAKTTPENDLRNVRGVKALLRTPRTRRSIKNDLTNVSGVKKIFAKSPKNRLSDVRVKEVFVASPKNDLRRVTGVKSLFQATNKRKSPRNELDDVRGVKKLFNTKSPANDLRNVSGVKRTLRRQSPNNDLSDLRGVKRVFRRERQNDLSDVSGVEELFNLSNYSSATVSTRAESLFDQLVGKPQMRAVYSKTFSSKTVQKTKSPRGKTLHASLDQITAADNNWLERELNKRLQIKNYLDSLNTADTSRVNRTKANKSKSSHASLDEVADVDVLLEQELNKEQHITKYLESMRSVNNSKANTSKANRSRINKSRVNKSKASVSKANMSRSLLKLVTDTVEGSSPLRSSRVRGSTQAGRTPGEELRLPLKKRSLADTSAALPLKKRAVQHSTPLKRRPVALNASVLARVSPIRADDDVRYAPPDTSTMSTQPKDTTERRSKSTRSTRVTTEHVDTITAPEAVELSPKNARGRAKVASPKTKPASPVKIQDKSANLSKAKKESPAKPRKASPTKATKASPAKGKNASPAKTKKASPAKAINGSPAKTRQVSPSKAKKASPAKAKKASPAKAVKGSPAKTRQVSPSKAKKASPAKTIKASPAKTRRVSPAKAKKASPAKTRRVSPAKAKKASPAKVKKASPAKTRKVSPAKSKKASPVKSKKASPAKAKKASPAKAKPVKPVSPVKKVSPKNPKAASPNNKLVSPVPAKTTRSRRNNVSTLESNTKKRGASLVVAKKSPVMSPKPRATRKRKEPETTATPPATPKKTRGNRKNESVKDDKPKTPKNTRAKVLKATVVVSKPSPQLKPRATRRGQADLTEQKPTRNTRKTVAVQEKPESPKKSQIQLKSSSKTRAAEVQPKTRGRKTVASETIDNAEVEKLEPKTKKGRKTVDTAAKKTRNTTQEKSIEEAKPVRARGKKVETQESVESAPSTRGRRAVKSVSIAPEVKTRKRKSDTVPDNELPSKVRKSKEVAEKGRKRATDVSTESKSTRKKSAVKESQASEAPVKVTRGRKTAEVEPAKPTKQTEQKTRSRKANIENVPVNQVTGKRKRQAAAEPSPVKERKTRATRGNTQPEGKPAGRSRRR